MTGLNPVLLLLTYCIMYFRVAVQTKTKKYEVALDPVPSDWFHLVVVFLGPGIGIEMYINGLRIDTSDGYGVSVGDNEGSVVLGREYPDSDFNYAEVTVDEMYLWGSPLSAAEISSLYLWY